MSEKTIILANPRGFCAGVDRAISIVERALEEFGAPIYVRHEVVHNKFVVDNLREKGAVFIENLSEVPAGATLIYSAHGVSKAVQEEAKARGFRVFDATCPLVTKVHKEVARLDAQDCEIIMIGHKGHVEVEGTMGQLPPGKMFLVETVEDVARLEVRNPDKLAYVSQTTLSVDETKDIIAALNVRFPNIRNPHKDLLRHHQPSESRQRAGGRMRFGDCGRFAQLLQQQPLARSRGPARRGRLHGGQRRLPAARMVRRQKQGRRNRRRIRPRSAGQRGTANHSGMGARNHTRGRRRGRKHRIRPAQRTEARG